jgi:5-epimerase
VQVRELAVQGAYEFAPRVFTDDRGAFVSPFQERAFVRATGHRLFPLAQTNHSRSARGVVRGVHFTATPPGTAKYVHCSRGRALDLVVDLRVGSPTFGRWDACELDEESLRSVYLPVGLGHAFVALEDPTVMTYLVSTGYTAEHELAVDVLDPRLGLPLPPDLGVLRSPRDVAAPTLAEAQRAGLLPQYAPSLALEAAAAVPGPDGAPTPQVR